MDRAYSRGYRDGYDEGYSEAEKEHESDYSLGFDDGYYAGAVYTCLFFGDIDRAFKSAINGCAWDTFVVSYDELVKDIYDTDEERSEIFWSLIGLIVCEDSSSEEIELLTSIFGRDLFINNGVSLEY